MIIGRSIGSNQRRLRKLMEAKDFAKLALLQDAANTDSTGQAILHYEGGTGGSTGGSGNTGGNTSGSGTGSLERMQIQTRLMRILAVKQMIGQKKEQIVWWMYIQDRLSGIMANYMFLQKQETGSLMNITTPLRRQ